MNDFKKKVNFSMIMIKSQNEISLMRKSGQISSMIRKQLLNFLKIGISTLEIDMKAYELMKKYEVNSSFKNYNGFEGYTCISVNEVVVHGIPSKNKILKKDDIVTIDIGINYKDYNTDSAWTYCLGVPTKKISLLLENTKKALFEGINQVKPGNRISDISRAIAKIGIMNNYGIIDVFSGHGIGLKLHEIPYIFNFDFQTSEYISKIGQIKDYVLKPGMTFCIEPMFTLGSKEIKILSDGWTAVSIDNSLSAHFEHTVLVTNNGYEILT